MGTDAVSASLFFRTAIYLRFWPVSSASELVAIITTRIMQIASIRNQIHPQEGDVTDEKIDAIERLNYVRTH